MHRYHILPILPFCAALLISTGLLAQHETRGDSYLPPLKQRSVSPAFSGGGNIFTFTQVNVDENGQNILGDAANEPSIAINPLDPQKMVMGWRQFDNVNSNFRQAGFGYTLDGGQTWTFPGVLEPGIFRSDPVLDVDADGRFYYNSLTLDSNFHCTVFRSIGDGIWDGGISAFGGDKQWMTIDKTAGTGRGHIYSAWNLSYTSCPPGAFTRSTDEGDIYEDCTALGQHLYWGSMDVAPDGAVYIAGTQGIAKSLNAQDVGDTATWQITYPDLGGPLSGFLTDSPNPAGLLGQVWVATNHSADSLNGDVYVLSSVKPIDVADSLDVMFCRSTDGGQSWSAPLRINDDDPGDAWQWFGTMSVAPNGRIDAVWLDTRDYPGTYLSSLYYSNSFDGGQHWSANERLSDTFDPHIGWPQQNKMGDYFHMISDNSGAHLAWAATFNGEEDVYYGHIALDVVATDQVRADAPARLFQNSPNPFRERTAISYQVEAPGRVGIHIYNQMGQRVRTLSDRPHGAGNYTVQWDGRDEGESMLPGGVYYCEMWYENRGAAYRSMILVR